MSVGDIIGVAAMCALPVLMLVGILALYRRDARRVREGWQAIADARGYTLTGRGLVLDSTRLRLEGTADGISFEVRPSRVRGAQYSSSLTCLTATLEGTPLDCWVDMRAQRGEGNAGTGDPAFDARVQLGVEPAGWGVGQVGPVCRQRMAALVGVRPSLSLLCARGRYSTRHHLGKVPPDAPADVTIRWEGHETDGAMVEAAVQLLVAFCRRA